MNRKSQTWRELTILGFTALASCLAILWLGGCSRQSDQQIQQQAAQTTEQVKAGAKKAAAEAKVAAENAKRSASDIAAGVREGLHNDHSEVARSIDINSASQSRLEALPGISAVRARRIIRNRPYADTHDLVSKGVLSHAEYKRISGKIVAGSS
ncbi:MAG: helix-hairpin-helix domain-containing protein [Acidobacteriaceae bacterium]